MGHCFSDSASFLKPIPLLAQSGIDNTPFQQNVREPRSPGFGHRGASLSIQEFTDHRDRSAMQMLALGEPPAVTKQNNHLASGSGRKKDSKKNKPVGLGIFTRKGKRGEAATTASLPKSLSPRKTKEGRKYFHIAVDEPKMEMFGFQNSSTYWVNQRRESKGTKRVRKKKSMDPGEGPKLARPHPSPTCLEKTRNADDRDSRMVLQPSPHPMIEDGKGKSQPPLLHDQMQEQQQNQQPQQQPQQQQQAPEPKTLIKSSPRPQAKTGDSPPPAANACRLIPRPDMGPNIRDFAFGNDLTAVARLVVTSPTSHDSPTLAQTDNPQSLDEAYPRGSPPTQAKSKIASSETQRPRIFTRQLSAPNHPAWPQASSYTPSTPPPAVAPHSHSPPPQWAQAAAPQTPQHSAQNSTESKASPLSSTSRRSHAPSSLLSGHDSTASNDATHSDAESGIIMNARSAEFVRAPHDTTGSHSRASSARKLPKPGPAPTRALPSLPEGHDAIAATAGRSEGSQGRISIDRPLERSPAKVTPSSPNARYRYSPIKTAAPKSPSQRRIIVAEETKLAPQQQQTERTLSDSPTIIYAPRLKSDSAWNDDPLKRDRSPTALERKQALRERATRALKERDLARLRGRREGGDGVGEREENLGEEEEGGGGDGKGGREKLVLLPRLRYSPPEGGRGVVAVARSGSGSTTRHSILPLPSSSSSPPPPPPPSSPSTHPPHTTTSKLSPIILVAEQIPTPILTPTPRLSTSTCVFSDTTGDKNATLAPSHNPQHQTQHQTQHQHQHQDALETRLLAIERKNFLLQRAFMAILDESAALELNTHPYSHSHSHTHSNLNTNLNFQNPLPNNNLYTPNPDSGPSSAPSFSDHRLSTSEIPSSNLNPGTGMGVGAGIFSGYGYSTGTGNSYHCTRPHSDGSGNGTGNRDFNHGNGNRGGMAGSGGGPTHNVGTMGNGNGNGMAGNGGNIDDPQKILERRF